MELRDLPCKGVYVGGVRALRRAGGWYNDKVLPDLKLGDLVRMRKPHPCGSYEWLVVRLGADIGLECSQCGRKVLLPRRDLARRIKTTHPQGEDHGQTS